MRRKRNIGVLRVRWPKRVDHYNPLLAGQAHQTSESLSHVFCDELPTYLRAMPKARRNHQEIIASIDRVRSDVAGALSLKEVARRVAVSVGYLEYRFPALVRQIIRDYRDFKEREKIRQIHSAKQAALMYFVTEKHGDTLTSRRQAYRELRAETGLPKSMLRCAIEEAYRTVSSGNEWGISV